jgi:hypothetical protein
LRAALAVQRRREPLRLLFRALTRRPNRNDQEGSRKTMSASTGQKIAVVVAFIVLGVPTGLCSIVSTPFIIAGFVEVFRGEGGAFTNALSMAVPWLVGFAIAYALIRQIRWTFSDKSGGWSGDDRGTPP